MEWPAHQLIVGGGGVTGCLGIKFINLCYKSCVGLYNAGNGREIRVH